MGGCFSHLFQLGGALAAPITLENLLICGVKSVAVSLATWAYTAPVVSAVYGTPISFSINTVVFGSFLSGLVSPIVQGWVSSIHAAIKSTCTAVKAFVESVVRTSVNAVTNLMVGAKFRLDEFVVGLGAAYINAYETLQIKDMELTPLQIKKAKLDRLVYTLKEKVSVEALATELQCTPAETAAARTYLAQGKSMCESFALAAGLVPAGSKFVFDIHGDFVVITPPGGKGDIQYAARGSLNNNERLETARSMLNSEWNSETLEAVKLRLEAALDVEIARCGGNVHVDGSGHSRGASLARSIMIDHAKGRFGQNVTMSADLFCEPTLSPLQPFELDNVTSHQVYGDFVSFGRTGAASEHMYAPREGLGAHALANFYSPNPPAFTADQAAYRNALMYNSIERGITSAFANVNTNASRIMTASRSLPQNASRVHANGAQGGNGADPKPPRPPTQMDPDVLSNPCVLPIIQLLVQPDGQQRFALISEFLDRLRSELEGSGFGVVALLGPRTGRSTLVKGLMAALNYQFPSAFEYRSTVGVWAHVLKHHRLLILEPSEDIALESFCVSVASHTIYSCRGWVSHTDLLRLTLAAQHACIVEEGWPISLARARMTSRPALHFVASSLLADPLTVLKREHAPGHSGLLRDVLATYNVKTTEVPSVDGQRRGHCRLEVVPWDACAPCFQAAIHHRCDGGNTNYLTFMQESFAKVLFHVSTVNAEEQQAAVSDALANLDKSIQTVLEEIAEAAKKDDDLQDAIEDFSSSVKRLQSQNAKDEADVQDDKKREEAQKKQRDCFFSLMAKLIEALFSKDRHLTLGSKSLYVISVRDNDLNSSEENHNLGWFSTCLARGNLLAGIVKALNSRIEYAWYFATLMLRLEDVRRQILKEHRFIDIALPLVCSSPTPSITFGEHEAIFLFLSAASRCCIQGMAAVTNVLAARCCKEDKRLGSSHVPSIMSYILAFGPKSVLVKENGVAPWPLELFIPTDDAGGQKPGNTLGSAVQTSVANESPKATNVAHQHLLSRLKPVSVPRPNGDSHDISTAIMQFIMPEKDLIAVQIWGLLVAVVKAGGIHLIAPQKTIIVEALFESIRRIPILKPTTFPSNLFLLVGLMAPANKPTPVQATSNLPCIYTELIREPEQVGKLFVESADYALGLLSHTVGFPSGTKELQLVHDTTMLVVAVVNTVNSEDDKIQPRLVLEAFGNGNVFRGKPLELTLSLLHKLGSFDKYPKALRPYRHGLVETVYDSRDHALDGAIYFLSQEVSWHSSNKNSKPELAELVHTVYKDIYDQIRTKVLILLPLQITPEILLQVGKKLGPAVLRVAALAFNAVVLSWDMTAGPIYARLCAQNRRGISMLSAPRPVKSAASIDDWGLVIDVLLQVQLISEAQAELIRESKRMSEVTS